MASKSKRRRVPAPPAQAPQERRRSERPPKEGRAWGRRQVVLAALAVGVSAGVLLIGLSVASAHRGSSPSSSSGAIGGIAETQILLDGVPQRRNLLGSSTAPVRLVEYADLQCPFCAEFARNVLPTLVHDDVRTGKLEIEFRGLTFIGPDSTTALKTATAAGFQSRMWNVIELLYLNQGSENAWITDQLLRQVVAASGADVPQVFADRDGSAVTAAIEGWQRQSQADSVRGTPTFFVGRRGGPLEQLQLTALTPDAFQAAMDRALGR
jgi:protein-disulfide isomerase